MGEGGDDVELKSGRGGERTRLRTGRVVAYGGEELPALVVPGALRVPDRGLLGVLALFFARLDTLAFTRIPVPFPSDDLKSGERWTLADKGERGEWNVPLPLRGRTTGGSTELVEVSERCRVRTC